MPPPPPKKTDFRAFWGHSVPLQDNFEAVLSDSEVFSMRDLGNPPPPLLRDIKMPGSHFPGAQFPPGPHFREDPLRGAPIPSTVSPAVPTSGAPQPTSGLYRKRPPHLQFSTGCLPHSLPALQRMSPPTSGPQPEVGLPQTPFRTSGRDGLRAAPEGGAQSCRVRLRGVRVS